MGRWLGVDVGGDRKGFDVAALDDRRIIALESRLSDDAVADLVRCHRPDVVAIDSPRSCAHPGQCARDDERELNRAICGIRWTPDADRVYGGSRYYEWVVRGLALYEVLAAEPVAVIEVFPTASWTRWFGSRAGRTRAAWTRDGLSMLHLDDVPSRTNQDQRDAIAAAVTAREHSAGMTESIGEIVVPLGLSRDGASAKSPGLCVPERLPSRAGPTLGRSTAEPPHPPRAEASVERSVVLARRARKRA